MIDPACIRSVMFLSVVVVVPLKLERIRSIEFNIREESFIWLKADSCNKAAALPGSTSIMCT